MRLRCNGWACRYQRGEGGLVIVPYETAWGKMDREAIGLPAFKTRHNFKRIQRGQNLFHLGVVIKLLSVYLNNV